MVDRDFLVDGIFVYYKILRPGSPKSAFDCNSLDSCTNKHTTSSYLKDSTDSEFMCTVVQSKNSVTPVDVLKFLGYPLDFSNYDVVFKTRVRLQDYFPDSVDLNHLDELSELSHQKRNKNNNNLNKNSNSFNTFDKKQENNGYNLFNKPKTLNMEFLRGKFDHFLGLKEKKKGHLVWVPVKLDEQLRSIDDNIYIKIYLLPKFTNYNTTNDLYSTETTHTDSITSTSTVSYKPKPESKYHFKPQHTLLDFPIKTKLDEALSPSDREEINNMVNKWSLTLDGKLKDIRSLLSTLQNIVSSEVNWEPMPLTLLVGDKNKIKSHYRRALLAFHPDKQKDISPKRKLLFELVIQSLMKSWNEFS